MEFDLKEHTQYLIISGSHSYGGNTKYSDYDLRGWCIPPRAYFINFQKNFEQSDTWFAYQDYPFKKELDQYCKSNNLRIPFADEQIDHCIYSISKFFRLAAACNPNLIENLFVDDREVLICSGAASVVRERRHMFLSAKAKHTFVGYAHSQLKRINTHRRWLMNPPGDKPSRAFYGLPEHNVMPADQRGAVESLVNSKVRNWLFQDAEILDRVDLALYHEKLSEFIGKILSSKDLIVELHNDQALIDTARVAALEDLGMTKKYISVFQAEKKYRQALQEWKQYQDWQTNRNPERAALEAKYKYDTKHALQLVRLLQMGKELLTKGTVTVRRPPDDIVFLRGIKQGSMTYEEVVTYLDGAEKELNEIYDTKAYVVPHRPNLVALGELCQKLILDYAFDPCQ